MTCSGLDISGRIDEWVITHGYANDLVGKPIKDSDGKTIGRIHSVDINKKVWYGRIVITDILDELLEKHSMEVK